jgi:hypothetical protein
MRFCEVFLTTEGIEIDDSKMKPFKEQLRETMAELLILSNMALNINANIIGPDQKNFHEMLYDRFQSIDKTFETKYNGASVKDKIRSIVIQKEKQLIQEAKELERKLKDVSPSVSASSAFAISQQSPVHSDSNFADHNRK